MSLLSYLVPRVVARYSTKYNEDIRVVEENGQFKLIAQGARESGPFIRRIWQKALHNFNINPSLPVQSILVFGVAGGTVIHLLHDRYPDARIDGVDIDDQMIKIGKQFFKLDTLPQLTTHVTDARKFLKNAVGKHRTWDIVVTDLFIGIEIPEFSEHSPFLRDIRSVVAEGGRMLINYNYYGEYIPRSDALYTQLLHLFPGVCSMIIRTNRFFCCQ